MYIDLKPVLPAPPQGDKTIRITPKGIIFNRGASEYMGLNSNSKVMIVHSDKEIYASSSDNGFPVRKRNHTYHINNRALARGIMQEAKEKEQNAVYRLGEKEYINGEYLTPIISRQNFYGSKRD